MHFRIKAIIRKPPTVLFDSFIFNVRMQGNTLGSVFQKQFSTLVADQAVKERPIRMVKDVLSTKPEAIFTIQESSTIDAAISHLVEQNLSSALALNKIGEITGVFTARDILRLLHDKGSREIDGKMSALNLSVKEVITRKENMVWN